MSTHDLLRRILNDIQSLPTSGITFTPIYDSKDASVSRLLIDIGGKIQLVQVDVKVLGVYAGIKPSESLRAPA